MGKGMKNREDIGNSEQELDLIRAERARARHKRRIRNQIIVYMVVAVMLTGLGAGTYLGSVKLFHVISDRRIAAKALKEAEAAEIAVDPDAFDQEPEESTEGQVIIETPQAVTEEVSEEPSQEELLDSFVDAVIAEMPLKDKVAGLFFVTPEQLTGVDAAIKAGDGTEESLAENAVGGLVYAQKNIKSEEQIQEMLTETSAMSKYPLFLATCEPGGEAGDLTKALSLDPVDAASMIAEGGDSTAAEEAGKQIAHRMVTAGFGVNMGTAVNLTTEAMNDAARSASFGSDPMAASQLLAGEVRGMEQNGVHAVLKMFPTAVYGSDSNIPSTEMTFEELAEGDFRMFTAAIDAGAGMVMVGNLAAPRIVGDNTPCSMSSTVIEEVLRGKLGFEGVVITDALDDSVITDYYTADQAAVAAIKAGADMIYRPENMQTAIEGVLDAVNSGVIKESRIDESLKRIFRIKYADRIS